MDELSLIALIQANEELYNVHHPLYTNQIKRDSIWDDIGKQLSENGLLCKERWQRIRDNFRKALILRKVKQCKRGKKSKIKPPKYYKQLRFLLPYLNEDDEKSSKFGSLELNDQPSPSDSPEPDGDLKPSDTLYNKVKHIPALKRKYPPVDDYATNKVEASLNPVPEPDPLVDFFIAMARTVKTFPFSKQLEIKGHLFKLVHETEVELLNQDYLPSYSQSFEMVSVETAEDEDFKLET